MRISDWSSDVCSSDLLTLLEALDREVVERSPEQFYYLARATYVKDEGLLDRFDQVFAKVFKAVATRYGTEAADIPADWLRAVAEKYLTPEEMAAIEALGSWDEIMETLKKRRSEEHTSELQSLMRISYAVFC